jgi:DNA-binding NtrC family response regulator
MGPDDCETPAHRCLLILNPTKVAYPEQKLLEEQGFETRTVGDLYEARAVLQGNRFFCLIAELQDAGGLPPEVLRELGQEYPEMPAILVLASASVPSVVAAMQAGAFDCLVRPFEPTDLSAVVQRAVEYRRVSKAIESAATPLEVPRVLKGVVGTSPAMQQVFAIVRKVAHSRSTVLITGESGTGKEVVARSIHYLGARAVFLFESVNVAAIPNGLLEAELFGHEKGAFTGADRARRGLFERASGGTLFLDEIGDLSLPLQSKLLRVLQDRKVRPLGSERSVEMDTRIIAATHRNLEEEVAAGRFREDLYYRLNVIPIHIPPLREHPEDIRPLAEAFIRKHADRPGRRISDDALEELKHHHWKGNIRELENTIERALALAEGDEIGVSDLQLLYQERPVSEVAADSLLPAALLQQLPLRELEDRYIEEILKLSGGNKIEAARVLGIDRRTLYRRTTG